MVAYHCSKFKTPVEGYTVQVRLAGVQAKGESPEALPSHGPSVLEAIRKPHVIAREIGLGRGPL